MPRTIRKLLRTNRLHEEKQQLLQHQRDEDEYLRWKERYTEEQRQLNEHQTDDTHSSNQSSQQVTEHADNTIYDDVSYVESDDSVTIEVMPSFDSNQNDSNTLHRRGQHRESEIETQATIATRVQQLDSSRSESSVDNVNYDIYSNGISSGIEGSKKNEAFTVFAVPKGHLRNEASHAIKPYSNNMDETTENVASIGVEEDNENSLLNDSHSDEKNVDIVMHSTIENNNTNSKSCYQRSSVNANNSAAISSSKKSTTEGNKIGLPRTSSATSLFMSRPNRKSTKPAASLFSGLNTGLNTSNNKVPVKQKYNRITSNTKIGKKSILSWLTSIKSSWKKWKATSKHAKMLTLPIVLRVVLLFFIFNFGYLTLNSPINDSNNESSEQENGQQSNTNQSSSLMNRGRANLLRWRNANVNELSSVHNSPIEKRIVPFVVNGNADQPIHFEFVWNSTENNSTKLRLAVDETVHKFEFEDVHKKMEDESMIRNTPPLLSDNAAINALEQSHNILVSNNNLKSKLSASDGHVPFLVTSGNFHYGATNEDETKNGILGVQNEVSADVVTDKKPYSSLILNPIYEEKPKVMDTVDSILKPKQLLKGAGHLLPDGDDNILLVVISNRIDGIIPSVASIVQRASKPVDVVLIGEHDVNEAVHSHFGHRIDNFISMTVKEVQDDLMKNKMRPIWTWPEWHSSIKDIHWKNNNTVHTADWDYLQTHAHELNHLRFYLPYLSLFQNKRYLFFMDDDILVHKDLGPVAADVMSNLPSDKGIVTACNIWIWNSDCQHFDFHDQTDYILDMPSLYGDRDVCQTDYETHCYPASYLDFIETVLPASGKDQKAWNFGFSLFAMDNWRNLQLTQRYESVMTESYRLHVFPETSLTFGLGVPFIAFAGAVECWHEKDLVVRDGFGYIEWNRYETTFGNGFYEKVDVVHYTGPDKPWVANSKIDVKSIQPWLDIMKKENLTIPDQLRTEPATDLFTLVASDRTGAQWLINTLDSHPEVCASGESTLPETGFSSDSLLPTGLPWYPECSIKRGCTYAFISDGVLELTSDIPDRRGHSIPRRCMKGYNAVFSEDKLIDHLPRLCKFVDRLEGNYTQAAIGRLWVEAFASEEKTIIGCSCPRGTLAKGIKVEPEWLTYDNFPDEYKGPPRLNLDESKLHGSKMIRLKRKNLWARFKSIVMAQKSGQYHLTSAEAKKLQETNVEKVQVAIEDLEWTINLMISIDRFGDEWANQHGSQVLNIEYETCRDDTPSCFKKIFEFLGVDSSYVESKEKRFESSFADLHLDESLDHILNEGAVKEALGANGWNDFVGLDDYHEIQLLIYDENELVANPHQIKGINSTVYGYDLNAEGFGCKLQAAMPLLRAMHPKTLVVLSNDRDVLINFQSGSDTLRYEAIAQFRASFIELTKYDPNAVVVSAQTDCCSVSLSHVLPGDYFDANGQRNELSCTPGASNCEWRGEDKIEIWKSFMISEAKRRGEMAHDNIYLDAGFMAGTASNFLQLISSLKIQSFEDDRAVLTDYMFRNYDKILIDYSGKLFGKSLGVSIRTPSDKCKDDDLDRQPRHFSSPAKNLTALFLRRPREVGCYAYEASSIRRFPSWSEEGIEIGPLLDHFNRVLIGKETAALPAAYGRVPDAQAGQEIPYVVDINGIYSSSAIRSRIDENIYQWRIRPTEALVKLAYRTLRRVRTRDEQERWKNILQSIDSGVGFPYWAWYGDYKSCNKNNYGIQSIPLLTTAAKADCDYSFPIPNYMTIIDTQRSSDQWEGVFQEFEIKYPWDQKINKAVWRGSLAESDLKLTFENIRWRLCKFVHESKNPLYDVGLTSISSEITEKVFVNTADVGGLASVMTPMLEFMNYRAIIDMDGNSWSSRFGSILCFNSVVIKIEPKYTEYFFADLLPWMHYIPVKNDLSDLHDNVAWALNPENAAQVKSIISAANQFCSQRLTPANLAHDLLDIWETYVGLLNRFDPMWSTKWKDKKNELFAIGSKSQMLQI